jgi:hypothetical protein
VELPSAADMALDWHDTAYLSPLKRSAIKTPQSWYLKPVQ